MEPPKRFAVRHDVRTDARIRPHFVFKNLSIQTAFSSPCRPTRKEIPSLPRPNYWSKVWTIMLKMGTGFSPNIFSKSAAIVAGAAAGIALIGKRSRQAVAVPSSTWQ